MSTAINTCQ